MLMDKRTQFASAEAIGGSTGRRLVGDVIDLGNVRDIGAPNNIYLVVQLAVAMTSGGSATVQIELASDAQAAIAVDGSATVHLTSPEFAFDSKIVGDQLLVAPIPQEFADTLYERYLGVIVNVGTAALTAGSINAFLTDKPPIHKSYPDGDR
jgi:hypothetical protein